MPKIVNETRVQLHIELHKTDDQEHYGKKDINEVEISLFAHGTERSSHILELKFEVTHDLFTAKGVQQAMIDAIDAAKAAVRMSDLSGGIGLNLQKETREEANNRYDRERQERQERERRKAEEEEATRLNLAEQQAIHNFNKEDQ